MKSIKIRSAIFGEGAEKVSGAGALARAQTEIPATCLAHIPYTLFSQNNQLKKELSLSLSLSRTRAREKGQNDKKHVE